MATTEIYDPSTGRFTAGPDMTFKRFKLRKTAVTLKNGWVLISGGANDPEAYDPVSAARRLRYPWWYGR